MKNIILGLIFMTFPFLINAQKTITYEEMKTITKGIFENITCDIYVAKDGKKYRIGDTLKIAQPSSRETYAFINQANKITSAAPPRRVVVGNETELQPLPVSEIVPKYVSPLIVNGMLTIIQKFEVTGSKRRGFTIKVIGKALCVSCPSYFIDFEEALTAGEIQSAGMTREQAIAKLKEAKDLVDLGMMSKEDFEKLKAELSKIILQK